MLAIGPAQLREWGLCPQTPRVFNAKKAAKRDRMPPCAGADMGLDRVRVERREV
ncbi:hypothetical protein Z950_2572 [Sulfitobacter mediterraneus KCTC 32188]|nr:hypothetical protein Z950_2572 [Sulfitobacter mediterraneus KCTC 32188]